MAITSGIMVILMLIVQIPMEILAMDVVRESWTDDMSQKALVKFSLVEFLYLGLSIASVVFISIWVYQAASNKFALGHNIINHEKAMSPGWSVGVFFIPILWFWKPYLAIKQIWYSANNTFYNNEEYPHWFIIVWWSLYIFTNFISGGLLAIIFTRKNLEENPDLLYLSAACSYGLTALLTLSTIYMMVKITRTQRKTIYGLALARYSKR